MAFEPENWGVISSSGNITAVTLQNGDVIGAPGLYTYASADDNLATVTAANYFSPIAHTLAVNDIIEAVASDAGETLSVSSINYNTLAITVVASGISNVSGPASSTNNALVRWNGTTGRLLADGTVLEDGSGNLTGVNSIANAVGAIGAPSYTFTGRTTNGMWSSAANTIDFSTNALRGFQITASPGSSVNWVGAAGAATTHAPTLSALGGNTNIDLNIVPKGTGALAVVGATNSGSIKLWNQTNTFWAQIQAAAMASNVTWTWPATDGTSGQAITTNASGVLSFSTIASFTWNDQTSTPVTVAANNGYITDDGASLITYNMPAVIAQGSVISISGKASGGWLLQMNTGQVANLGTTPTSSGGSLASTNQYDCISLLCVTANTTFVVQSVIGNITVA